MFVKDIPAIEKRIKEIQEHQKKDAVCRQIAEFCYRGWPDKRNIPSTVKHYFPITGEVTVERELLLLGSRIVIPETLILWYEILEKLHEGHQQITKCRERACQSMWWPGISTQLED